MTEIAGEISGASGIPFRGYSSFCMSVLFPGASADYHPVIRGMEVCDILLTMCSIIIITSAGMDRWIYPPIRCIWNRSPQLSSQL